MHAASGAQLRVIGQPRGLRGEQSQRVALGQPFAGRAGRSGTQTLGILGSVLRHTTCFLGGESYTEGASMEPENHTLRLLIEMRAEMRARFDAIDSRFEGIESRFEGVDARFDAMDRRFDVLEDIARDTAARLRMHERLARNMLANHRKHGTRLEDLEHRVDDLEGEK